MREVIVIGAGVAGAATAHALHTAGCDVLVLEKATVCSGGSHAAGAFLSPKISRPSPYKSYLNTALACTLDYYARRFPDAFVQNGLMKLPLDEEDARRCESYEPYIDFPFTRREGSYFFQNTGITETAPLLRQMLGNIETIEGYHVTSIRHDGEAWMVNDTYRTKHLVLATGSDPDLLTLPYLQRRTTGGYRYDVRFRGAEKLSHNIHKDVSVSTWLPGKESVVIGATHIKGVCDLEAAAREDRYGLLKRAEAFLTMPDAEILAIYTGYRSYSFDYFPIVGQAVDAEATQRACPGIGGGARVPAEKFHYYPNLYLHTALGSRGFVFAPYNAKLLADHILHDQPIPDRLLPATRFMKWVRRRA